MNGAIPAASTIAMKAAYASSSIAKVFCQAAATARQQINHQQVLRILRAGIAADLDVDALAIAAEGA